MVGGEAMSQGTAFRQATERDIGDIVAIFDRSRAVAMPFLPRLHTLDEDRAFFEVALGQGPITLAIADRVVGFMAETEGWIEHLYLDPNMRGRGVGDALVAQAKARQAQLELWCFAENHAACRFYERQGFSISRRTDGDNEEGLPDILYLWQREPA